MLILGIVVAAALLVFLASNLTTAEKKIRYAIEPLYGVDDPQFLRVMGSLLGPGILAGNRARELLNGDRIFPAMLDAIQSARESITFETYIYFGRRRLSRALA